MRIIDISPLIDETIAVWPGDTPFTRTMNLDIRSGANFTLSEMRTTLHVGAHTDAPNHYVADGDDIASRNLEFFVGRCNVVHVEVHRGERIMPRHIERKRIDVSRVLFRTNSFPDPRNWNDDFASLSPDLVDALHARGVILIGIDTPSVDVFDSKELPAHKAFLRNDVAILEGLALAGVPEGTYELIALPLRLEGFDASPVRAVLRAPGWSG